MALDILITNDHGKADKSISLYTEDYDFVMDKIEHVNDFPLLKRILADYYGESEVYLNELEILKREALMLNEKFGSAYPKAISDFMADFFNIIDYAIMTRKTIQLIGD